MTEKWAFDSRLSDPRTSSLIVQEGSIGTVVIGSPHHAPLGQSTLPCEEHPDADENAGFLVAAVASQLRCHSIIAANSTHDPNKRLDTPYSRKIADWKPRLLVEIHGHGGRSAKFDLEVSCGSPDRSWAAEQFANGLSRRMAMHDGLRSFSISGRYSEVHFRARRSATIANAPWLGIHVELPAALRKGTHDEPVPATGYLLCNLLALEVAETLTRMDAVSE